MARARSPEKRHAILQSAVREIAREGLGASTAKIAAGAGLAEGTLFTYFPTKEDLLNELYIELKTQVYQHINAEFPQNAPLRDRALHIWTAHLRWAMKQPDERRVSVLLNLSPLVHTATRQRLDSQHEAIRQVMEEVGRTGAFAGLPKGFASSAMLAMQEAVLESAARRSRKRAELIWDAFNAFWRMVE